MIRGHISKITQILGMIRGHISKITEILVWSEVTFQR